MQTLAKLPHSRPMRTAKPYPHGPTANASRCGSVWLTVSAVDAINAAMPTTCLRVACAAAWLGAACGASGGTPDEELVGLVHTAKDEAPAIDVGRAARDPAALAAAVAVPEHRVTAALGPHTLRATSTVQVTDGAAVLESLTDEVVLDDAGDDFH